MYILIYLLLGKVVHVWQKDLSFTDVNGGWGEAEVTIRNGTTKDSVVGGDQPDESIHPLSQTSLSNFTNFTGRERQGAEWLVVQAEWADLQKHRGERVSEEWWV